MLAPDADPSRRASNEQPSEDVMSIIQEARDDDRLPEEVSPLLDDSTIGVKNVAGAAAAGAAAKQQLKQQKQAQHGEAPVPCYRRPATRNLVVAGLMLVAVAFLAVELGPDATQEALGRNVTLPDIHLPKMPKIPKIDWSKLPPMLRPGGKGGPDLLYDPDVYPWARDVPAFLQMLDAGRATVDRMRKAMWDERAPNSELVFPHVDIWNPEPLRRSMNRAILEQGDFVIGVMGTSVTAGHDNYFNQSFPVVWGRLMEEAFTATNVSLVLRNHAMGWNPIHPSYYCVGEIAGADSDITVWEFGMMGGGDGDMEQWLRSSFLLPKQPHVLLCDTMEGCRDARGAPIEKRTDPPPGPWEPGAIKAYYEAGLSVATTALKHSYMFLDHTREYDLGRLYAEDKPTDRPASWHPGPHGHRLRADILAYNYLGWFGEAIDEVRAYVGSGNTTLEEILPQQRAIPAPVSCQTDLCTTLPQCLTTFAPRAGPSLRTALAAPTESEKLPFVEDFGKAQSMEVKEWHEQLYNVDVPSITHMLQLEFNYLDRKWILQGENAGPLAMEFESNTENYIMLCGPPGHDGHCNVNTTTWTVDGASVGCKFKDQSLQDGTPWVEPPCAISDRKIPAGKHRLEVNKQGEGPLEISHLIWW